MKKYPVILYSLYALFHVSFIGVAFFIDAKYPDKIFDLIEYRDFIPTTKWVALFGLLLFVLNGLYVLAGQKSLRKDLADMEKEKNLFKAKMYDMQEAIKGRQSEEVSNSPDDNITQ